MPSVERVQWAKFRVAAVAVSALMILGTLVYLLTGGTLFEAKSTIYLYMPDAVGLLAGAPVRVSGFGVGKVESVRLTGSNIPDRVVRVTMSVDRDRLQNIPDDSTAQASSDNPVGDKFVDIDAGHSPNHIKPGGELLYKASPDLMKRLDIAQFEQRLREMDALISDIEAGRSPFGKFVQGEEVYVSIRRRLAELQSGIRAAAKTTGQIGNVIYTDALYRQFVEPLRGLDLSLAKIQSGQGPLGQFLRDDAQYAQLRGAVNDLRFAMQGLHGAPWLTSDAQYTAWNQGIQSMIRTVDEFAASPMLTTTATYDNLNGLAKELGTQMKEFRENPRKFLRFKLF